MISGSRRFTCSMEARHEPALACGLRHVRPAGTLDDLV